MSRPGQSRPGQALVYGAQYATSQQGRDAVAEWAALAKLAAAKMERGQGAAHVAAHHVIRVQHFSRPSFFG